MMTSLIVNDCQVDGVQAALRRIKDWRRLKGTNQLPKVIAGVGFENGIEVIEVPANHAA